MKRRSLPRVATVVVVLAIAMIPLVYAGLLTSAYQNPTTNIGRIHAAVVDEDTATDVTLADGHTERLDLGHQLETSLTRPDGHDVGFTWAAMDAQDAHTAMEKQQIRAILTIPRGFTAAVTKAATTDVSRAATQTLQLSTDDGINYMSGTLATSIAARLEDDLTTQGSGRYIGSILVSLGTIRAGMVDADTASARLGDGAHELDGGVSRLVTGTNGAAQGAARVQDGAQALARGTVDADAGAATLDSGAALLARGTQTLVDGVNAYTAGVTDAAAGARGLASGVDTYVGGVHDAASASSDIAGGAAGLTALASGVDTYTTGVDHLKDVVVNGDGGNPSLAGAAAQLSAALGAPTDTGDLQDASRDTAVVAGADAVARGSDQLAQMLDAGDTGTGASDLGTGAAALAQGVQQYTQDLEAAQQACTQGDAARCTTLLSGLTGRSQGLVDSATRVSEGAATVGAQVQATRKAVGQLDAGAQALLTASQRAASGAVTLQRGIGTTTDSAHAADTSQDTVVGALETLASRSGDLRDGATKESALVPATQALSTGLQTLDAGASSLSGGAAGLQEGTRQLASNGAGLRAGAREVSAGATTESAGTTSLTEGLDDLARGGRTLSTSTGTLSAGVSQLASGAAAARSGSEALSAGAKRLTRGLGQAATSIPDLSGADSSTIASVISRPVAVTASRDHAVANNGGGFAPMFMSLALWVGTIAIFLVLPALDRRPGRGEKWWSAATRPLVPASLLAVVQAVVLVAVVNAGVGLRAANLPGLILVAVATSLAFVTLNQAFIASLAYRGRFVSLVLLSLQIASMGGAFPVETAPRFLQLVHPWLPMSYTQLALRAMLAGGGADHAVRNCLMVLAAWAAAALALSVFSAYRRSGPRPLPRDNALLQDQVAEARSRSVQGA